MSYVFFFFLRQKTAYELRISDWSSDVCSSDLFHAQASWSNNVRSVLTALCTETLSAPILIPVMAAASFSDISRSFSSVTASRRSEERRVGTERVSPCRSRWLPYRSKKNIEAKKGVIRLR